MRLLSLISSRPRKVYLNQWSSFWGPPQILRPQFKRRCVARLLPILFSSEYNYTLCEKMGFGGSIYQDPFFKEAYLDINPEFWYGHHPKDYLCARKVKNLRCEESKKDCLECTLSWTELPKFIPNPKYGAEGPLLEDLHLNDALKQVIGEREVQYTYSTRSAVEAKKKMREKKLLPIRSLPKVQP